MTPAVAALPGVTVYTKKCEDVLTELIAAGPYGAGSSNILLCKSGMKAESLALYDGVAGVIACDANVDSDDAMAFVGPVLPLLSPGGVLIFTVKCPTRYVTEASLATLEANLQEKFMTRAKTGDDGETQREWASMDIVWLLANTDHERTLIATAAMV